MSEKVNYNPDILSCLANLSSDEVFTPPEIANSMLDMLPQELFKSPETKFLDPGCKSGVFLREIAKRLNEGLSGQIPDIEQRMDHIMKKQLFAIAITQITSLLSRRSVYCTKDASSRFSVAKFDNPAGNIRFRRVEHKWDGIGKKEEQKCVCCGASRKELDRGEELETHAYEFIHMDDELFKDLKEMKFDVIIGNPPYQLADGGAGPSAMPIYQKFVEQAKKLNPRFLTMITPSRWFAGGRGLDDYRSSMISDKSIRVLVDFESSKDCFEGVDIAGGVSYFLWDRDNKGPCHITNVTKDGKIEAFRYLDQFPVFIRSNNSVSILEKVMKTTSEYCSSIVLTQKPFGFRTYARGSEDDTLGIRLLSSEGWGYVKVSEVEKNRNLIDTYKVFVGRLVPGNGEVDVRPGEGYKVITSPRILKPKEICTESYIVIGTFNSEKEAVNYAKFICTKTARFLIRQAVSSVNINKDVFNFLPLLDFKQTWSDEDIWKKFGITEREATFIDYMMKDMTFNGGADA